MQVPGGPSTSLQYNSLHTNTPLCLISLQLLINYSFSHHSCMSLSKGTVGTQDTKPLTEEVKKGGLVIH